MEHNTPLSYHFKHSHIWFDMALLGVLFIGVINGALPIIQVSPFWQQAIAGVVILVSVVANARANGAQARQILEASPDEEAT